MMLNQTLSTLRRYDIRPSKRAGQHNVVDPTVLDKMVDYARLSREDVVLEIGAGIGNLTRLLVQRAGKIISIERGLQSDEKKSGSSAQTLQVANGEAKAQAKEQGGAAKLSLIIDQNDFIKNIVASSKYAVGDVRFPIGLSNARSLNFGSIDLDLIISELVDKVCGLAA